MGRINKTTEGVFVDIVGTETSHSAYDVFIKNGSEKPSKELKGFVDEYKKTITENKTMFERLSRLEEIIMQLRAMETISDIKLSLVREYIYARCSFYRKEKTAKDIRVIVDNVEFWNSDMDKLLGTPEFMDKAKTKLIKAMDKEVQENVEIYNALYKN
jgi:hypothetical protein